MATVINNPDSNGNRDGGSGMGMLIGAIVLVLILILFFVYGLPAIRKGGSSSTGSTKTYDVNVSTPSGGASGSATGGTSGQ